MLNIIPLPKKIEIHEGFLREKKVRFINDIKDVRILKALKYFEIDDNGVSVEISIGNKQREAYSIEIKKDNIVINADCNAGAFYAIQTLRQIFVSEEVPCCYIMDEPDFKYRGFYHDITRGKIPKVETIKNLIDDMAYYKLNSLQLYVEHTYEFEEYADSIERTGFITSEELKEIDEYCRMNFIELVPSLSTFGHLYELLQKTKYKHLQTIDTFETKPFFWENRMSHHTIDPTRAESFEIIKSLIDQYIVNFSSDKFNICCDETFDLEKGKHKNEDTGKLYVDFVTKIVKYLQNKGKTVMMWADILLKHPDRIDDLSKDVELLNWDYWDKPDENSFKLIHDANVKQIVCPGTGSWSRLCEDYEMEIVNIGKMVEFGYKYGAEGVLNTNWGDWGNPCCIELAMFGLVLGAAKSWNVSTTVDDHYIKSVNRLLYKSEGANEYIKRLSLLCREVSWYTLAMVYANIVCGKEVYDIKFPEKDILLKSVEESFGLIKDISAEKWEEEKYREQILITAEGLAVMAEIIAICAGYSVERKTDTKKWIDKYKEKWMLYNKESEYAEIEKMFLMTENYAKNICAEQQ